MLYYSTKGNALKVSFKEALLNGLAPDGGLYIPESIPNYKQDFFQSDWSFPVLATAMIHPFVADDLPKNKLSEICHTAFDFPVPILQINDQDFVLELFHGPTLAFKDFAARFMARVMSYYIEYENRQINILVATSGDTGSAVANGFYNVEGINVIVLYPADRISKIQEKQMTTLGGNVKSLKIDGSFDDCQRLVKTAFNDVQLRRQIPISSANSINIARLLPQAVYYAWAWNKMKTNDPIVISVPSGNFGNLTGGILAKRMGLPIEKFIASTNANDVFPKYLLTDEIQEQPVRKTISNAMDVSIPSNLERIRYLYNNDIHQIRSEISGWSFSDEETKKIIRETYIKKHYLTDPHTAVGMLGLQMYRKQYNSKAQGVVISTAHPSKFQDVIEPIIGEKIELPVSLQISLNKKGDAIPMQNNYSAFKEFLMENYL